jgi:hypothetical protein
MANFIVGLNKLSLALRERVGVREPGGEGLEAGRPAVHCLRLGLYTEKGDVQIGERKG